MQAGRLRLLESAIVIARSNQNLDLAGKILTKMVLQGIQECARHLEFFRLARLGDVPGVDDKNGAHVCEDRP